MICLETQYFGLNRILLLAIGLWPYQQSRFTRFQFMFLFVILMASIIFQLTAFMTLKCTAKLVITVLSSASFFIIFMTKYYAFRVSVEPVKKLLIKLQYVCNELKDKNEIAIIEKYGYIAKCYTAIVTAIGICGTSANIIGQFWLNMPDVALSINISQPCRMQLVTEYFVDQRKYFFLILLHTNAAICIGAAAMIAIGTMLIAYFEIICGMFKISSYRIERAVKINILQNITFKNKIVRSEHLICAVDIHRQAMKLSKSMLSKFEIMFFCLTALFVISLCFNFVRIFQIISSGEAVKEVILPVIIVVVNILYLFISNSLGQDITDHNNYLFATVYRVEWYLTPLHIQKMILFLLQKGSKDFTMSVSGLFVPSLECFATRHYNSFSSAMIMPILKLVKASVSYFTVILSTQ